MATKKPSYTPQSAKEAERKPAPAPAPKPAPKPAPAPAPKPAPLKPSQIATFTPSKATAAAAQKPMADQGAAYVEGARLGQPYDPNFGVVITTETPTDTTPVGGGGGGGGGVSAGDVQRMINEALARQAADQKAQRDREASAFLKDILSQYGMSDLAGEVDSLVQQWGNSTGVIANNLRQTGSYKNRFKGLLALQQKGITDIRNEAEYINLETQYRQTFREAGLQNYLGSAGTPTERDAIAKLVGDYTVSVNEVKNRISDAQRVVNETAPEVKDALQRYYNVSAADLVAYTLDPTRTQDQINRKANAAIFGGLAQARGLDADVNTAESIAALSGTNDLSTQNAAIQLGAARQVRDATKRLANLEATDLTDSEILQSEFSIDPEAQRKIKGLQSRERARFGGSSAAGRDTLTRTSSI